MEVNGSRLITNIGSFNINSIDMLQIGREDDVRKVKIKIERVLS